MNCWNGKEDVRDYKGKFKKLELQICGYIYKHLLEIESEIAIP